ncbi:hypothetical protein QBC38DRAFT_283397 [Podospora fimiseda]|uniref:Uncharacterized protein n=1 Tax=Podospora fimiseda TaxID=252190 RepID=A0AAN7BKE5_9PEZI|nr:hypothetical protein QBC38DRAFT_283397 [Podospora fimiseda]
MADNLSILDDQHRTVFETALNRILASELAETTFAEILDGLPTQTTWFETHSREPADHPVFALEHHSLCPGILEKVKGFRQTFDPAQLTFSITVLEHFQQATPDTKQFKLRLIELLAVACHQIAVYLWNLYDGPHKHSDYEKWRDEAQDRPLHDPSNWYRPYIAPTPFYHRRYIDFDQYPNDIADIVGYWAEARIFGGVVVFNRGESGNENSISMDTNTTVPIRSIRPQTNNTPHWSISYLVQDKTRTQLRLFQSTQLIKTAGDTAQKTQWSSITSFATVTRENRPLLIRMKETEPIILDTTPWIGLN